MLKKYFKSQSGVTLIESLVAMMVITVGLVAILSLALSSLTRAKVSKEQIVATALVREGIEITRTIRDTNWLQDIGCWSVNGCGLADDLYALDYTNASSLDEATRFSGDIEEFIFLDNDASILKENSESFYNHSSGDATIYRRVVQIEAGNITESKHIRCRVYWNARGKDFYVDAETILTNWR
ncbi:MAG: prepilin-type N-terminal cleavage/methylation domain-containing protein [Patescibacteria group bacterium]